MSRVDAPYPLFTGLDNRLLDNGYVWFGVENGDPQVDPVPVFADAEFTIPLSQPLRTKAGVLSDGDAPVSAYIDGPYSIRVRNSAMVQVYYQASAVNLGLQLAGPNGAAAVGFLQAGTGAVLRTVQDKEREIVAAKDFGASTSATPAENVNAIQKALNTGKDVYLEELYSTNSPVLSAAEGQRIFGRGYSSGIVCTGANTNSIAIAVTHDHFVVENLRITPGTTVSSLFHGWGVAINANRCIVRGNFFKGMRRGGVILNSCNNCTVTGNIFTDSVVAQDGSETQGQMGYDIYLYGTSSYNIVTGNECVSRCGVGIGLQNVEIGKSMFGNIVSENVVRNHPCYGIMLYLSSSGIGVPGDRVDDMIITSNVVTDISGSVLTDGVTLFYGAGIYIQGADNFACSNNMVLRTNTDQSKPRSGSDVPAAIGISGFARGSVVGNVIDECHHGIAVINGSFDLPVGDGTTISANQIDGVRKSGIYLASANSATITGNRIKSAPGNTDRGIAILQGGALAMGPFQIANNFINGFGSSLEANTSSGSTVGAVILQGNKFREFATYGAYIKADEATLIGNDVASSAGVGGVVIGPTVLRGTVTGNIINMPVGTALEDSGPATSIYDNMIVAGTLTGYPALLANSATPSLAGRRFVANYNTTTITGFTGGKEGQTVVLTAEAAFTIQHGPTLILRDAVNRAMTVGQAMELMYSNSRWREI
ncbi:right-handed parallel beta-helix repeat-containing protein [Allosphingosinicella flava]|uniref:Right-handed parallel beta-helix repeat-containing protein n=1 Tax=Allosphingosinicella flava TaxID=2771430 RepID=A0A7T2GKP2_9SPHN|nr:right-handed parallel beta-helix repeat-containing protein [Sphingosinicella flava]